MPFGEQSRLSVQAKVVVDETVKLKQISPKTLEGLILRPVLINALSLSIGFAVNRLDN